MKLKLIHLVLPLLILDVFFANDVEAQKRLRISSNMSDLTFYLHTTDVGASFAEAYGHVQIRIVDALNQTDYMVSWGLFDFNAPNFGLNFYRGRLLYRMGMFETRRARVTYRYDHRTVWQDKINFTNEEKQRLLDRIYENMKPENQTYLYNYFWDNCSTRPRDFIDYALDGRLKEYYEGRDSDRTWRQSVRYHQSLIPLSGLWLEVAMNSNLDVTMTRWQEMYLPEILRESLFVLDRTGGREGEKLLTDSSVFYQGGEYIRDSYRDYWLFYLVFGAPLLLIFLLFVKEKQTLALRLMGVFGLIYLFIICFTGTIMPVSWLFSDHADLKHNANMLLFLPIDWWFFVPTLYALRGKSINAESHPRVFGITKRMIQLHVVLAILLLFVYLTGIIDQNVGVVFGTFGLLFFVYLYLVHTRVLGERVFRKKGSH